MHGPLSGFAQDLRYGCRTLARNPAFALVAILTLALGIGANAAIFQVLDSALLRTLPVPHPDDLTLLTDPNSHGHGYGSQDGDRTLLAFWEFRYLHDHNDVFSGMFAADSQLAKTRVVIARGGVRQEEPVRIRLVSGDYFATLGVTPALGHFFGAETDGAKGASPVAVISYNFWERRFARDPAILGTKISIRQTPFEVVAVAQPGFFGETVGEAPELWIPLMMQDSVYPGWDLMLSTAPGLLNQQIWLQVMARRKPGVTLQQAGANVAIVVRRMTELGESSLAARDRHQFSQRVVVRSGAEGASVLRETFGEPLRVLMALVGLMLLIACANVANLLLARGASREKEFALRLAIGAGRGQAVRQLLTESFLLALPGAIAGFFLAGWADSLLLRMVPGAGGRPGEVQLNIHPDARVLLFTAGIAVVTSVLFGLAPALRLARLDLSEALKSGPGAQAGGGTRSPFPIGKLLVVAQVAASLVMLVATGLFVQSLRKLSEVNLGFNRDRLIEFALDPLAAGLKGAATSGFHQQLLNRLSAVPGVRSVTLSGNGLFAGSEAGDPIAVEGYSPQTGERMNSRMDLVGPSYFSTVGIPILMGREIGPHDRVGARVAVINQAFARHFFPHMNPLGKHVRDTYDPAKPSDMTIVGVVADARANTLRETVAPRLFAPYFQPLWQNDAAHYEVRTFGDPATVALAVRRAVSEASPALPPIDIDTVAELVDNSLVRDRLVTRLSAGFGVLAMLLASIGLYGVMTWTMSRRTREIGVRIALGARPQGIVGLVLRDTLSMVIVGIAIGIPLALAATRLIQGLLFGVSAADPLVIALASILLIAVATLAGYLPARRAARVDPMIALRHE